MIYHRLYKKYIFYFRLISNIYLNNISLINLLSPKTVKSMSFAEESLKGICAEGSQ